MMLMSPLAPPRHRLLLAWVAQIPCTLQRD